MTTLIRIRDAAGITDFKTAVEAHAKELTAHALHLVEVDKANVARAELAAHDKAETKVNIESARATDPKDREAIARRLAVLRNRRTALQATATAAQYYPPPQAHPLIMAAIAEHRVEGKPTEYVPDYQLVDALPIAADDADGLARRKNELTNEVHQLENAALVAVTPSGKARLFTYRAKDIADADTARRVELYKTRADDSAETLAAIEAKVIAARSPEDAEFLAKQAERAKRAEAIGRHAASLTAEIEDLTAADAHLWKPTPFAE